MSNISPELDHKLAKMIEEQAAKATAIRKEGEDILARERAAIAGCQEVGKKMQAQINSVFAAMGK